MKRRRYSNAELNQLARHYDGPYKPYDLVKELCIAIVVVGAMIYSLVRFRKSQGAVDAGRMLHSTKIEILWTVIPVLIVILVAIPAASQILKLEH